MDPHENPREILFSLGPPLTPNPHFSCSLALWSVAGVWAALALGEPGEVADLPAIEILSRAISPVGTLWLSALPMTVIPLWSRRFSWRSSAPTKPFHLESSGAELWCSLLALTSAQGSSFFAATSRVLGWFTIPPGLAENLASVRIGVQGQTVTGAVTAATSLGWWPWPENPGFLAVISLVKW